MDGVVQHRIGGYSGRCAAGGEPGGVSFRTLSFFRSSVMSVSFPKQGLLSEFISHINQQKVDCPPLSRLFVVVTAGAGGATRRAGRRVQAHARGGEAARVALDMK